MPLKVDCSESIIPNVGDLAWSPPKPDEEPHIEGDDVVDSIDVDDRGEAVAPNTPVEALPNTDVPACKPKCATPLAGADTSAPFGLLLCPNMYWDRNGLEGTPKPAEVHPNAGGDGVVNVDEDAPNTPAGGPPNTEAPVDEPKLVTPLVVAGTLPFRWLLCPNTYWVEEELIEGAEENMAY